MDRWTMWRSYVVGGSAITGAIQRRTLLPYNATTCTATGSIYPALSYSAATTVGNHE